MKLWNTPSRPPARPAYSAAMTKAASLYCGTAWPIIAARAVFSLIARSTTPNGECAMRRASKKPARKNTASSQYIGSPGLIVTADAPKPMRGTGTPGRPFSPPV